MGLQMSVAKTKIRLSRAMINTAKQSTEKLAKPVGGWIKAFQETIGLSASMLADRVGVSRNSIYKAIENERSGTISLNQLNKIAEAMGGKLVYAIVPADGSVEDIVLNQARKKAHRIVSRTWAQMALEEQSEGLETRDERIERMAREVASEMPKDLWR